MAKKYLNEEGLSLFTKKVKEAIDNSKVWEPGQSMGNFKSAQMQGCTAMGIGTIAEGSNTVAGANMLSTAHAEGGYTQALGQCSHAEGTQTIASGHSSHASGYYTVANNNYEFAAGMFNVSVTDPSNSNNDTLFSVGNGATGGNNDYRHNAFHIDKRGNVTVPNTVDSPPNKMYPYDLPMMCIQKEMLSPIVVPADSFKLDFDGQQTRVVSSAGSNEPEGLVLGVLLSGNSPLWAVFGAMTVLRSNPADVDSIYAISRPLFINVNISADKSQDQYAMLLPFKFERIVYLNGSDSTPSIAFGSPIFHVNDGTGLKSYKLTLNFGWKNSNYLIVPVVTPVS